MYQSNLSLGAGNQGRHPQLSRGVLSGHKSRSWRQQRTFSHLRVRQREDL